MSLWVIDEWVDEMTVGSKREVDHDDFHRLLSHITYGGHICSPACAESVLVDEDKGIPEGYGYAYKVATTTEVLDPPPPDPRYPEDGNG